MYPCPLSWFVFRGIRCSYSSNVTHANIWSVLNVSMSSDSRRNELTLPLSRASTSSSKNFGSTCQEAPKTSWPKLPIRLWRTYRIFLFYQTHRTLKMKQRYQQADFDKMRRTRLTSLFIRNDYRAHRLNHVPQCEYIYLRTSVKSATLNVHSCTWFR